ncbi:MAG: LacI family transcriptional regulator [Chloroflexi bacterium]|nr:MAG: LacI family transcriptional regulator [Chloroflexota bacterium]
MENKVTIADVARLANVSVSTVSNMLNGRSSRMRPSTHERILQAIEELGYTPNQAARQLKTGHTPIIGLIVPSVANPFFGVFARHVEEEALSHGFQVLLGNSERQPDREQLYADELWGYGVRGIIFGSALMEYSHLDNLINRGLHVVAFDRPAQDDDPVEFDSIGVDNMLAARLATKHLLSLGHRRIGFLSGAVKTINRIDRLAGYKAALVEAGVEFDPELIWEGDTNGNFGDADAVALGRQGTHELLSQLNPPTAIFTINDMYAFGSYAGARDLGLEIPRDLSIVGMDDIALTEVVQPPLTTIRQPVKHLARAAVDRLIGRLNGTCTAETERHQTLAPRLIVRASTARLSTARLSTARLKR